MKYGRFARWGLVPAALALQAGMALGQVVSPFTGQTAPIAVCFAKGTDPKYMESLTRLVDLQNQMVFGGATDYHIGGNWPVPQGTPLTLTWSFVPDGIAIPGGIGESASPSELFTKMDAAFAGVGGRAAWIARFQQIFDRWTAVAGVHYSRVTFGGNDWDDGAAWGSAASAGRRGDVRISMHSIDGPFGVLAYNGYPTSSDMVVDSDDIAIWSDSSGQYVELRNTLGHEHGHGLGLAHTCSLNSNVLMQPEAGSGYDGPQQDDIRGAQRNYGDPFEVNDSAATAKAIGTVGAAGLTFGNVPAPLSGIAVPNAALCSIDASGKVDWYSFTTATSIPVGIKVTPVGSIYDDSAQAGGCPGSPNNINAAAIADLAVQAYSNGGTVLLGSASSAGLGAAESLTVGPLNPGTYQIKVSATNAPASVQLYKIDLTCPKPTITTPPNPADAYAGNVVTLSVAATNATTYRWRRGGINMVDSGNISGTGTPTLRFGPAKMADSGMYSVSVGNGCGATVSVAVALNVTCYPNCDDSTTAPILNVADFTCFVQRFNAGEAWANCDGSTIAPTLNILDFACFMDRMAAGCP